MKALLIASTLLSLFQVEALASNSADAFLSQSQRTQLIDIMDQQYEPITEQQPYQATCSRQVLDRHVTRCTTVNVTSCSGGGQVCSTRSDTVCNSSGCRTIPRRVCSNRPRVCHTSPRQSCNTYPVYRTDHYSCTQYRTVVVGQRLVKTYNHTVEVILDDSVQLAEKSLLIKVLANQNHVTAALATPFTDALLPYSIEVVGQSDSSAVQDLAEKVVIRAIDAKKIKEIQTASIEGLELGYEAFKFKLKGGADLADLVNMKVELVRNRKFWFDKTLIDDVFDAASLGLVSRGEDVEALVPLQKLGVDDELTRFRYDLSVSLKLKAVQALNSNEFAEDFNRVISKDLNKTYAEF